MTETDGWTPDTRWERESVEEQEGCSEDLRGPSQRVRDEDASEAGAGHSPGPDMDDRLMLFASSMSSFCLHFFIICDQKK